MAPPQGKCIRQEAGFLFMTEVFVPSYVGGGWRAEAFFTAIFTWQNFLGREDLDYCMVLNTTDSQGDNLVKQCLSFLGMVTSGKGPSALWTGFERQRADYLPGFASRRIPVDFPQAPIQDPGGLHGVSDTPLRFIRVGPDTCMAGRPQGNVDEQCREKLHVVNALTQPGFLAQEGWDPLNSWFFRKAPPCVLSQTSLNPVFLRSGLLRSRAGSQCWVPEFWRPV